MRIWLAIGAAALGWGTSAPATRAALATGIPPIGLAAMRTLIAALVVTAIVYGTGRPYQARAASWKMGAMMGTVNLAVPFVTTTIALQYASSGFNGLLIALVPIGTAVLAHYVLPDEPIYRAKVTGLSIAFVGVVFLLASGDSGLATGGRPLVAAPLTVIAVVSIAYAGIYAKQRQEHFDPVRLTGMQLIVGTAWVVPLALITEGAPPVPTLWGWMLVGYVSIAGSVLPFLFFYWVLQRTTTTVASLTAYVVPLISLVSGIVLLDERLDPGIAVGGALIIAGLVVIDRFERRRTLVTTRVVG